MKNTEIEQADDRRREQSLRKLDQGIKRIECVIKELLDGVDISELTTEKRLVIGARFVTLHQRAVALRHTFELDHPEVHENLEVSRLMRLMRGEPEMETNEAICIVDATDDARPITPYQDTPSLG